MKSTCADLLLALGSPQVMPSLSPSQWDSLLPQSRAAGLLGRLGALAQQHDLSQSLPLSVWHALEAGLAFAERQAVAIHYELAKLDAALAGLDIPVLVLKGAAYVASGSAAAGGRLMSDIDILVRKADISRTEVALMRSGWISSHHDTYDQRYYRQWMHEIPPMQHIRRGTILDVHHNLLPETARIKTDPDKMIAAARPLPGMICLHIPSALDLILHSATHLMHEGEWGHGLRDLTDLHALVRAADMENDDFWAELANRARELNLERPLHYALANLARLFGLAIPSLPLARPGRIVDRATNALLARGLSSFHSACQLPFTPQAEFLLYVRSHWLRMPLHLLLPHLLHKAFSKEPNAQDSS